MNRFYFSTEDISIALMNAGIELRPEDCLVTKFHAVARELEGKARKHIRRELESFAEVVLK
jgi:hypothetical protein